MNLLLVVAISIVVILAIDYVVYKVVRHRQVPLTGSDTWADIARMQQKTSAWLTVAIFNIGITIALMALSVVIRVLR